MGASPSTHRPGLRALVAAQPVSVPILVLPFAAGLLGAAAVGLLVGFGDTDDQDIAMIRSGGAFVTGLAAGVVSRGLWGWVAASAGATIGVSPFLLAVIPDPSLVLGASIASFFVVAPGYVLARAAAYSRRFVSMRREGRPAALRAPLRRLLRIGVVLSGAGVLVLVESAIALPGDADLGLAGMLTLVGGICASYVMYRLVDGLDRGERRPALVFTVVYGVAGVVSFAVMLAAGEPVAWAVLEILVPSCFMALAPWLLVKLVREQLLAMPHHPLAAGQPPSEPDIGVMASTVGSHVGAAGRRSPSIALSAGVGVVCLAAAVAVFVASHDTGPHPTPESAVIPHDAPEVEALLPDTVGNRPLAMRSVRGEATLELWGLGAEEISEIRQQLTSMGVELDDVVQATAGRWNVQADPPYLVFAFSIPPAARELLVDYVVASARFIKDIDDWQLEGRVIDGKDVEVGRPDLVVQDDHQRGRPYLYAADTLDTWFIVISDDETWAADAIRQLPD